MYEQFVQANPTAAQQSQPFKPRPLSGSIAANKHLGHPSDQTDPNFLHHQEIKQATVIQTSLPPKVDVSINAALSQAGSVQAPIAK